MYEDTAARNARHRDTIIGALAGSGAMLAMMITTGERRWGPLYVVLVLTAGVTNTVLDARRAGWRWEGARWSLLFTAVVTVLGYGIWWLFYR
jgi:hypothetical protein